MALTTENVREAVARWYYTAMAGSEEQGREAFDEWLDDMQYEAYARGRDLG